MARGCFKVRRTTLGTYIRSLRIKKGMTQAQLAELLNVTDKAVSKWERDLSYPDITILPKLADVLGIRVSSIIDESIGEGSSSGLIRLFEMSHDIRTPLHIIIGCADIAANHLGDDNKELLIKYLRSIRTSGVYLLDVLDKFMREQEAETTDVCFDKNEKSSDNEEPASPVSPDFLCCFYTIHFRHQNIHQDHIIISRFFFHDPVQTFSAISDKLYHGPCLLQYLSHDFLIDLHILHDQKHLSRKII